MRAAARALDAELSTAEVYAEADELGLARAPSELEQRRRQLRVALELGAPVPAASELLHNDLQAAALSLEPTIALALEHARAAGADHAFVSGSGPTVLGLFENSEAAARAAHTLASKNVEALSALPITPPG